MDMNPEYGRNSDIHAYMAGIRTCMHIWPEYGPELYPVYLLNCIFRIYFPVFCAFDFCISQRHVPGTMRTVSEGDVLRSIRCVRPSPNFSK